MKEFFKNFEPFGMNFKKFRSIEISSVVVKILKSYPSTRIKVKSRPIYGKDPRPAKDPG